MTRPPKFFDRILEWYCKQVDLEDMQGDFYEVYEERLEKSKAHADRQFILDVIKLFNPLSHHRKRNTWLGEFYGFNFKNQFKVSGRNLKKHPSINFIQILGLAVAFSVCLYIFDYTRFENSFDSFHENKDRIFRIVTRVTSPEFDDKTAWSQVFLKEALEEESPEVGKVVRLLKLEKTASVEANGQIFRESNIYFSDPEISEVFSYPWIKGNSSTALEKPNAFVLTESTAMRYFNSLEVLGKQIKLNGNSFEIAGVLKDIPENSDLQFDVLLPFPNDEFDWSFVYVLLKENASLTHLETNIKSLSEDYNYHYLDEGFKLAYDFEPIESVHFSSPKLYDTPKSNQAQVIFFQILGLVILIIALVNFINLYTAQLVLRIGNINMQRVIGANKAQLFIQFAVEGFLYFGSSILIAVGMIALSSKNIGYVTGFDFFENLNSSFFLLITLLFITSILASAVYALSLIGGSKDIRLAELKAIKTHFRKGLIGVQFALSYATIIATIVIYQQISLIQDQNLGFTSEQVVQLEFPDRIFNNSNAKALRTSLGSLSPIQSISMIGSNSAPGMDADVDEFYIEGSELMQLYENINVDENFLKTLEIDLLAGRFFSSTVKNEHYRSLVVNEAFVKHMGWGSAENALGKEIDYYHIHGEVIGVTENFYFRSPHQLINPMVMIYDEGGPFALVKLNEKQDFVSAINQIETAWNQHLPDSPFAFSFLKSEYEKQYRHEQATLKVVGTITILVIVLSVMGIYAILLMMGNYREKEMGIRKVNGASAQDIFKLFSKEFFSILLIGQVVVAPLIYLALNQWLEHYPVRLFLNPILFVGIVGFIFIIVSTVIYVQTLRSFRSNTVDALKYE